MDDFWAARFKVVCKVFEDSARKHVQSWGKVNGATAKITETTTLPVHDPEASQ